MNEGDGQASYLSCPLNSAWEGVHWKLWEGRLRMNKRLFYYCIFLHSPFQETRKRMFRFLLWVTLSIHHCSWIRHDRNRWFLHHRRNQAWRFQASNSSASFIFDECMTWQKQLQLQHELSVCYLESSFKSIFHFVRNKQHEKCNCCHWLLPIHNHCHFYTSSFSFLEYFLSSFVVTFLCILNLIASHIMDD